MASEFENDLATARADIDAARVELLAVVNTLSDADLDRARRGGWSVRKVMQHVVESEWLYVRLASHLAGAAQPQGGPPESLAAIADIVAGLEAGRAALDSAIAGVEEEAFYRLQEAGHEEYSVLSLLENVALHDREHGPQVETILSAT